MIFFEPILLIALCVFAIVAASAYAVGYLNGKVQANRDLTDAIGDVRRRVSRLSGRP
jgi:hypothetical protein